MRGIGESACLTGCRILETSALTEAAVVIVDEHISTQSSEERVFEGPFTEASATQSMLRGLLCAQYVLDTDTCSP